MKERVKSIAVNKNLLKIKEKRKKICVLRQVKILHLVTGKEKLGVANTIGESRELDSYTMYVQKSMDLDRTL